ncbi:MAG TPA: hypothetical protein VLB76_22790 [Thermoanaerobaculia bacterium]|jgi:hypothetical protein|nr:hypothetical protein [Thermoanaerobaculia bacterium]
MKYNLTTRQGHRIIYEVPRGARVDVGYWDLGSEADTTKLNAAVLAAACPWPPDFVITYPLDGSRLSWQHWTAAGELHANSADRILFNGKELSFVQYLTADWTGDGEPKTVGYGPGPDSPRNLISKILGVHDQKAPWKARLTDLVGAAFKEFAAGTDYSSLYSRYMGVPWPAPDTFSCPDWKDVDAAGGLRAALGDRDSIRIGVYPSAPYYYPREAGSTEIVGFEYELGNALVDIIGRHYEKPVLRADWIEAAIELPGDGTDNDVLFAEFARRIDNGDYDLVFSAILTVGRQDRVAFACNTELFHIDTIYTGRGDFGAPPTGSLDRIAGFLADRSIATETPIQLVHTAAKDQTKAAGRLADRIRQMGGTCEASTITLPEIPAAVHPGGGEEPRVHVYVGDMIQIQRMSRTSGKYPIDLDVNLYTDQRDVITPLFLAPFGRRAL